MGLLLLLLGAFVVAVLWVFGRLNGLQALVGLAVFAVLGFGRDSLPPIIYGPLALIMIIICAVMFFQHLRAIQNVDSSESD